MIIRIFWGLVVGGLIGAVLGYFGRRFFGTRSPMANLYRGVIFGAVEGLLLALVLPALPEQKPASLQEKPVPVKKTAAAVKEKTEMPKVGSEHSNAVNVNSVPDSSVKAAQENRSNLVESLTKDSFLEKVFNYEQNKEWKFEGKLPCIVDFYADWCRPCKMVEPILQELAQEYQGKLNIYRVDTQAQQELAAAFGIRSIPSMLFVPLNEKPQMAVGALPKSTLEKVIKEVLKIK